MIINHVINNIHNPYPLVNVNMKSWNLIISLNPSKKIPVHESIHKVYTYVYLVILLLVYRWENGWTKCKWNKKKQKVEMFVSGVNTTSILYTMLPVWKNSFCPA